VRRRTLLFGAALALGGLGACTAHAPRRMILREDSTQAIATTVDQLSDASLRRRAPEFTLAFIEFDDQGRLWSPSRFRAPCDPGRANKESGAARPSGTRCA
jgi:hypothetical protein